MARRAIGEDLLVQAGPRPPAPDGPGFYDRFRGRLLFPIRVTQGRVVAFGGRALGRRGAQVPELAGDAALRQGQTLYALDVARAACASGAGRIIVEGYLDCLMAHQHGFTETVAALGTAFTRPSSASCAATATRSSRSSTPTPPARRPRRGSRR